MYKVGIIGLGKIAIGYDDDQLVKGIYTHAGAYNANSETKIAAGCDIDKEKLESFGKKLNIDALYSDYSEMLKNEELDIISICTHIDSHYVIIKEAVKYDIKAIFCEKPMTDNIENADEIIQLCSRKNIVLAVNHTRRWDKGFQKVKEYIFNKEIGNVQKFTIYYNKGIFNSGSHVVDLLNYFFGEIEYLYSEYSYEEKNLGDPTLDVYLKFKSGLSGVFVGCNSDYFQIFELDIIGTKGRIYIKDIGYLFEYYKVGESDKFSGYKKLFQVESPFVSYFDNAMPRAVSDILECIKKGRKPLCSGEDARNSLAVLLTAIDSAKNQGKKILIEV